MFKPHSPLISFLLGGSMFFVTPFLAENRVSHAQTPSATSSLEEMTLSSLEEILREEADNINQRNNQQWQLEFQGRSVFVIADEDNNRMRIVSPITQVQELGSEQVARMMVANYHTALDARYAINQEGVVVAAFLHPLNSLQDRDLRSALSQVAQLAETFGSNYSSGGLGFTGERNSPSPELPSIESETGI